MTRYKSKCKLVKGWNELIDQVDEDLNNLTSMKISPYYKAFEEEIVPWHEKLEKLRIIMEKAEARWLGDIPPLAEPCIGKRWSEVH